MPSCSLRSSDKLLLSRPYRSLVVADKAFSVSVPNIWNDLFLTVVLQLEWIVLNVILNTNSFPSNTLITPSSSCLLCLRFHFLAWTNRRFTNWSCICIWKQRYLFEYSVQTFIMLYVDASEWLHKCVCCVCSSCSHSFYAWIFWSTIRK